jgi:hypothetical protein
MGWGTQGVRRTFMVREWRATSICGRAGVPRLGSLGGESEHKDIDS